VTPTARPTAAELARALAAAVAPRRRSWVWGCVAAAALAVGCGAASAVYYADLPPTDPFARGCWLVRHDQPAAAVASFAAAEANDPSGRAAEWLAYCHARSGNHLTALKYGDSAVAADRHTVAVYANRAAARLGAGDASGAVDDAERARDIDPNCRAATLTLVKAKYRSCPKPGPVDRRLVAELEGVAATADDPAVWVLVAEARVLVADPTDADIASALEALRQARRLGQPRENLERNHTLKGRLDPERFRAALDTAAAGTPPHTPPYLVRPDW
jgi:tetratricopeptide (TPR) repeat protein